LYPQQEELFAKPLNVVHAQKAQGER